MGAIREQQLKQTLSGNNSWSERYQGAATEVDAIREQQMKWTLSGSSNWSGRYQGAATEVSEASEAACT